MVNVPFTIDIFKIFQKNGVPENFIDRCFKLFSNRTQVPTVEKKRLRLFLPYLGTISLL